jgi:DNA-directed RNA polymerase specialized sigma24 family protein
MATSLFAGVALDAFVKRGSPVQSRGAARSDKQGASTRKDREPQALKNSDEVVLPAIGAEVAKLAWRNRWLDVDDLKQEALLTALKVEARGLWRSSEAPVNYMARAVRSRLLEMVMSVGCPVKVGVGSHRDGSGGWEAAYAEAASCRADDVDDNAPGTIPNPEEDLDRQRAIEELRTVLEDATPAARAVILGEEKPAAVAKAHGLTAAQVYWQTEKARAAVKARLLELVRG